MEITNPQNKHYSVDEVFLYSHHLLAEEKRTVMDQHLLECEKCRALFLRLLEEEEAVAKAESRVPLDFTETVLLKVAQEPPRVLKKKASAPKKSRRQFLTAYAVVACLTVFLSWNGVFSPAAQTQAGLPLFGTSPVAAEQDSANPVDSFVNNLRASTNQAENNISQFFSKFGGYK